MKVEFLLLLFYLVSLKKADPIKAPLHIISYDDISPAEREHLAFLEEMNKQREKRSGHSLLSILGNGLKNKLGSLAKASASSSAHFVSSSSGGDHHYHHDYHHDDHHDEHDYEQKTFDFWTLNKSILNTLLQAVKAIKGATIALTGKLIKGSGYLVSAKGKLISHGGDAVTSLGKKIATSAILSPVAHGSHSSSYSDHPHEEYHSEYGPSSHQDSEVSPSAIAADYNPPPDLSNKYLPSKYSSYEDKNSFLNQLPEGIIILKKMPSNEHRLEAQESQNVPDFKPLDPEIPSYREVLANLLASSSSSNTNQNSNLNSNKNILKQNPNSSPSFEDFEKNLPTNNINVAQLPLEHKSPSVNYLKYFKDNALIRKPATFSLPTMMKVYNPQMEFAHFNPPSFNSPNFNPPNFNSPNFNSPNFNPPHFNPPNLNPSNFNPPNFNPSNFNRPSFNSPPTSFQSFSNQPFLNEFNSMPMMMGFQDLTPQFSTHQQQIQNQHQNQISNQNPIEFPNHDLQPEMSNLEQLQQLHDPRSFSKSKSASKSNSKSNPKLKPSFLPTPLTSSAEFNDFIVEPDSGPGKVKKLLASSKSKRPNVDVVKSITYELRPDGPVKI